MCDRCHGKHRPTDLLKKIQIFREEQGYSHREMLHAFAIGINAHNLIELGVPVYGLDPEEPTHNTPKREPTPEMDKLELDTLFKSAESLIKTKEDK